MTAPWYVSLFDANYLLLFDDLPRLLEAAEAEVEFLDRALGLSPGSRILDLGCGFGRHALGLARRGYAVTGLDRSRALLDLARTIGDRLGLGLGWEERDMRDLAGLGPFDACVCLATAFGYFDDAENRRVLEQVRSVLSPDGQLVLDVFNPLALLQRWSANVKRQTEHGLVEEIRCYRPESGRLETDRVYLGKDGRRIDYPRSDVRMYAPHELFELLRQTGFSVEQVFGSLTGDVFDWSTSMTEVCVARRVDP
jgi:SAM-dependent methyltransferase